MQKRTGDRVDEEGHILFTKEPAWLGTDKIVEEAGGMTKTLTPKQLLNDLCGLIAEARQDGSWWAGCFLRTRETERLESEGI